MKFTKRILSPLEKVYAVSPIQLNGTLHILAATEEHGRCLLFSPPDWTPSTVWTGPGGTMSLIPLLDPSRGFLAIQEFFPIFQSEHAGIVYAEPAPSLTEWTIRRILDLPFVHRIETIKTAHSLYLVAATLCGGKAFRDDWSKPGTVYAGRIPDDPKESWTLEPVFTGINKNHGMYVTKIQNRPVVLVTGTEGLFSLQPPNLKNPHWNSERILDHEISDLFTYDLDADGKKEIVTIEPFHGDRLRVYRNTDTGWQPILDEPIAFGHALWAGLIQNQPVILFGNRGGQKELAILNPATKQRQIIDRDIGPTQVTVLRDQGRDLILSANHAAGQVALYKVTE